MLVFAVLFEFCLSCMRMVSLFLLNFKQIVNLYINRQMASRAYTTHRVDITFTRSRILSSRDDAKRLSDGKSFSGSWRYTVRNHSSVRRR